MSVGFCKAIWPGLIDSDREWQIILDGIQFRSGTGTGTFLNCLSFAKNALGFLVCPRFFAGSSAKRHPRGSRSFCNPSKEIFAK